jgi:hypothetical protein
MPLDETLQQVLDFLRNHWTKWLWTVLLMVVTWFVAKWRARSQWRKKEFLGRLNVSLNMLRDGKLLIRTVIEKSLQEVLLNSVAVATVSNAAKHTTEANPILPLPKEDTWYILNSVLNEVAERFSLGEIRRDMGLPVATERYLICLTRERAGEMKTQKIRAMLIKKSLLLNLPTEAPQLESPTHITRFKTLQSMAQTYSKSPEQFLEMEVSI